MERRLFEYNWSYQVVVSDLRCNTYTWYIRMREGKIFEVIAFFDTIEFYELRSGE